MEQIDWNEVRQQMIEATAGMDQEKLVITMETSVNILGYKIVQITISDT